MVDSASVSKAPKEPVAGEEVPRIPIVVEFTGIPVRDSVSHLMIYTPSISRAAAAEHWNIDLKVLETKGYLNKTPYAVDPGDEFLRLKGMGLEDWGKGPYSDAETKKSWMVRSSSPLACRDHGAPGQLL